MMVIDSAKISNLGNTKEIFKLPKTKTAAILTGCKNISDIRYISDNTIEAIDWGINFEFSKELPKDINAIGIRAHEFVPVWEETGTNLIEFKLKSRAKLPFEDNYYLYTNGNSDITWLVQKDIKEKIAGRGLPKFLQIDEENILLLK